MANTRVSADEMLHRVEKLQQEVKTDEKQKTGEHRTGKLKIFFGYAAGVGKTYAMLESAHRLLSDGVDVVCGYIEPHTRPETTALLEGLSQIPPKEIIYKGVKLLDFDIDAVLARRPQVVLVDELAHTNAAGMRHLKRYQDVEELLAAGIDVYTTVNVQHIESLNDLVGAITGIDVTERVPDRIFDMADQVEVIDLEPDELIERLEEGKIYRKTQAEKALLNFFTKQNLQALREITLRRSADRLNLSSRKEGSAAALRTNEHILVCISSSPSNAKVIRNAARMADAFHCRLSAIYVNGGGASFDGILGIHDADEEESRARLRSNIRLAEELDAQVTTVYGNNTAAQIAEYAKASGITKIVLGRTGAKRRSGGRSLTDRLTEAAPDIDVYIIPDKQQARMRAKRRRLQLSMPTGLLHDLPKMLLILAAATVLSVLFYKTPLSEANIITVYIMGIMIIALWTDTWVCGAIASLISVLLFNFFFTQPRFSLEAYDPSYPLTFAVMFIASFITNTLMSQIRTHSKQTALQSFRTQTLLETSQLLQQASGSRDILRVAENQLYRLFRCPVICYRRIPGENRLSEPEIFQGIRSEREEKADNRAGRNGKNPNSRTEQNEKSMNSLTGQNGKSTDSLAGQNMASSDEFDPRLYRTPDERAVAEWSFHNAKHAGATTNTLPSARCLYLAVRGQGTVHAVLGLALPQGEVPASYEKNLMLTIVDETGMALDKEMFAKEKKDAEFKASQEELRANLLRAISHDLRTPLTSISGNAGILLESGGKIDAARKQELYANIYDDAEWLIHLVENLLSVTRLQDNTIRLQMQPELLEEVFDEALLHIDRNKDKHQIETELSDDMLMADMDVRLIVQVIINLINNAIKYTPEGSHIKLCAHRVGKYVMICVIDDGPGIPDEAKPQIFDMFYTANKNSDRSRSMGLGLALCRSIVNAHGGDIRVRDAKPHGAEFYFTLKAVDANALS